MSVEAGAALGHGPRLRGAPGLGSPRTHRRAAGRRAQLRWARGVLKLSIVPLKHREVPDAGGRRHDRGDEEANTAGAHHDKGDLEITDYKRYPTRISQQRHSQLNDLNEKLTNASGEIATLVKQIQNELERFDEKDSDESLASVSDESEQEDDQLPDRQEGIDLAKKQLGMEFNMMDHVYDVWMGMTGERA